MKIRNKNGLALFVLVLISSTAWSADQVEMKRCSLVQSDLKRLACYDQLSKQLPSDLVVTPKQIMPRTGTIVAHEAPSTVLVPQDTFGLERKIIRESADSIVSTIVGEFKGWRGKTLFNLANGQVWKQSNSGTFVYQAFDPEVTISRGAFGAYYLKVTGKNKTVLVRRIK